MATRVSVRLVLWPSRIFMAQAWQYDVSSCLSDAVRGGSGLPQLAHLVLIVSLRIRRGGYPGCKRSMSFNGGLSILYPQLREKWIKNSRLFAKEQ